MLLHECTHQFGGNDCSLDQSITCFMNVKLYLETINKDGFEYNHCLKLFVCVNQTPSVAECCISASKSKSNWVQIESLQVRLNILIFILQILEIQNSFMQLEISCYSIVQKMLSSDWWLMHQLNGELDFEHQVLSIEHKTYEAKSC